jgi:DNA-binding beta-propeller fold protein YncE
VNGRRQLLRASLIFAALAVLAGAAGSARAGGSPIGFVVLPAQGTLAVIELPKCGTLARIRVPGEPTAVAASVNGRRVLVASPNAGTVTEIDGVQHRVLRTFRALADPVAVALDYEPPVGIVTPRYGFALERGRGTLAVLDLDRGRIASRLAVGAQPDQIAVDGTTLWVAHAGSATLTRVDVSARAAPRMLASVHVAGGAAVALSADPELDSVFVSVRRSGFIARYVDGGLRARRVYVAQIPGRPLAGIAVAAPHLLIVAEERGVLDVLREQDGRRLARLRGALETRALAAYGGWLVAILPRGLGLVGVPDGSRRTSVAFASRIGGFAWSVL